jgi:hypothetical protein
MASTTFFKTWKLSQKVFKSVNFANVIHILFNFLSGSACLGYVPVPEFCEDFAIFLV